MSGDSFFRRQPGSRSDRGNRGLASELVMLGNGRAALLLVIPDSAPGPVREAVRRRRSAVLDLHCVCGSVFQPDTTDFTHDPACIADDTNFARALREWHRQ